MDLVEHSRDLVVDVMAVLSGGALWLGRRRDWF